MKDKWAPQEKDPPHVNFMKKAEITNSDGKIDKMPSLNCVINWNASISA